MKLKYIRVHEHINPQEWENIKIFNILYIFDLVYANKIRREIGFQTFEYEQIQYVVYIEKNYCEKFECSVGD